MPGESYHWHYDYARLAWDSGFCFDSSKSKATLNRNEIGSIDIDRIIKERDISLVDRHLHTVVESKLDEEQLQILEQSFSKLFRLSQLSVEYLIYCKQYLDHTVVLLKKELYSVGEKNVKMKSQLEQKDSDIARLKKKNKDIRDTLNLQQNVLSSKSVTFNKSETSLEENFRLETDKLQSEIKELKEKLNSKERFCKESLSSVPDRTIDSGKSPEPGKVSDLQKQFELLKEYVSNELKHLQAQRHDSAKLEEWGQLLLRKITETSVRDPGPPEPVLSARSRRNSHTQTDEEIPEKPKKTYSESGTNPIEAKSDSSSTSLSEIKSRHNKSNNDTQLLYTVAKKVREEIENRNDNNLDKLGEAIERKVCNTMESFQGKMEKFWTKLEEIEEKQTSKIEEINKQLQNTIPKQTGAIPMRKEALVQAVSSDSEAEEVTVVKKPSGIPVQIQMHQRKIENAFSKSSKEKNVKLPEYSESESSASSESESESTESGSESEESEEEQKEEVKKKPSSTTVSTWGLRSTTSSRESLNIADVSQGLKEEMTDLINIRLKNLGLSPTWKGLPNKSYKTAHEIIQHQANLTAKHFDSYWKIQKNILTNLNETVKKSRPLPKRIENSKANKSVKEKLTKNGNDISKSGKPVAAPRKNVPAVTEKRKPQPKVRSFLQETKEKQPVPPLKLHKLHQHQSPSVATKEAKKTETVTKMYGSDSEESEDAAEKARKEIRRTLPKEVIKELKEKQESLTGTFTRKEASGEDIVEKDDKDNSSVASDNLEQKDSKQKSNLKNYPSYGSLVKKKVLFDVDTSSEAIAKNEGKKNSDGKSKQQLPAIKVSENVSSSSVDSTVLDGSKTNLLKVPVNSDVSNSKKKKPSSDEELDWDISDILC